MEGLGFEGVVVAGEGTPAPALLSRQSVVAGVSDGVVLIFEREDSLVPMQLPADATPLPADILDTFMHIPVRQASSSNQLLSVI